MDLHHPVQLCIALCAGDQHHGLIGIGLLLIGLTAGHGDLERLVSSCCIRLLKHAVIQAMVCTQAAVGCKIVDSLHQSFGYIIRAGQFAAYHLCKLFDISCKAGLIHIHSLVRAIGGQHFDGKAFVLRHLIMPVQIIDGIIGGADGLYIKLFHQLTSGIVLQLLVAAVVDLIGIIGSQRLHNTKGSLQFQMAPMIHGVADQFRHDLRKGTELFAAIGRAGHHVFAYAVGSHQAPLIMIAAQPNLRNIIKFAVFCNVLRADMTMIVNDRHFLSHFMIQLLRCLRSQQKVLIHKRSHK